MKWSIVIIFLVLIVQLGAFGQTETSGTIIVIESAQNEIIFAADSRAVRRDSYSDDDCKIAVFGDKVIFAASGRRGLWNKRTQAYEWDSYTLARNVFSGITSDNAPQSVVEKFAGDWGIAMKKELEIDIASNPAHALSVEDDQTLAVAAFAEFSGDKSFLIVIEKIIYEIAPNGEITVKPFVDYRITKPTSYFLGKGEILREFSALQTPRSKEWDRSFELGRRFIKYPLIFEATDKVRVTIDNYPATRTDSAGKNFSLVGDPIAVARLTSQGVEWIENGRCPPK